MNYQKIYNSLISSRTSRNLDAYRYTEIHHIIPRSLGGTDDQSNLIVLTAREHFIAHLLLAKIYGGKMVHAAFLMSQRKRYNSRGYSFLREEYARNISKDTERSAKISKAKKGVKRTEEHTLAIMQARKKGAGWVCPEHKKAKQRIELRGKGNPMFGKTHSDHARKLISEANSKKVKCPYCHKEGGVAIMKRWHFDKCKEKS